MKKIVVLILLVASQGVSASSVAWEYSNYKSLHSASYRPNTGKLKSFGLGCSDYTKGKVLLKIQTKLAATTPRKGLEGNTPVTIEIDDIPLKFNMVNRASFPELLETRSEVPDYVIESLQKGRKVAVFWERWNGRLELEYVTLKNSANAIQKLKNKCSKIST